MAGIDDLLNTAKLEQQALLAEDRNDKKSALKYRKQANYIKNKIQKKTYSKRAEYVDEKGNVYKSLPKGKVIDTSKKKKVTTTTTKYIGNLTEEQYNKGLKSRAENRRKLEANRNKEGNLAFTDIRKELHKAKIKAADDKVRRRLSDDGTLKNTFSITSQARAIYDAATDKKDYGASIKNNNGLFSDNFAKKHEVLTNIVNGTVDTLPLIFTGGIGTASKANEAINASRLAYAGLKSSAKEIVKDIAESTAGYYGEEGSYNLLKEFVDENTARKYSQGIGVALGSFTRGAKSMAKTGIGYSAANSIADELGLEGNSKLALTTAGSTILHTPGHTTTANSKAKNFDNKVKNILGDNSVSRSVGAIPNNLTNVTDITRTILNTGQTVGTTLLSSAVNEELGIGNASSNYIIGRALSGHLNKVPSRIARNIGQAERGISDGGGHRYVASNVNLNIFDKNPVVPTRALPKTKSQSKYAYDQSLKEKYKDKYGDENGKVNLNKRTKLEKKRDDVLYYMSEPFKRRVRETPARLMSAAIEKTTGSRTTWASDTQHVEKKANKETQNYTFNVERGEGELLEGMKVAQTTRFHNTYNKDNPYKREKDLTYYMSKNFSLSGYKSGDIIKTDIKGLETRVMGRKNNTAIENQLMKALRESGRAGANPDKALLNIAEGTNLDFISKSKVIDVDTGERKSIEHLVDCSRANRGEMLLPNTNNTVNIKGHRITLIEGPDGKQYGVVYDIWGAGSGGKLTQGYFNKLHDSAYHGTVSMALVPIDQIHSIGNLNNKKRTVVDSNGNIVLDSNNKPKKEYIEPQLTTFEKYKRLGAATGKIDTSKNDFKKLTVKEKEYLLSKYNKI